jgi:hypothetical protein
LIFHSLPNCCKITTLFLQLQLHVSIQQHQLIDENRLLLHNFQQSCVLSTE